MPIANFVIAEAYWATCSFERVTVGVRNMAIASFLGFEASFLIQPVLFSEEAECFFVG